MFISTFESLSALGALVVTLALAAVLLMVFLLRKSRSNQDVPLWLGSAFVGILLGAAGVAALASGLGYEVVKQQTEDDFPTIPPGRGGEANAPGGGGMGAGGMGGGGPTAMMMGMGGGAARGPSPKRQLTTLVRKLELLTGDIAIQLDAEQAKKVAAILDGLKARDKLTDEQAQEQYDQLLAVLDDTQKSKQDAIGLPFRRGGGGGPGGGGPGGGGPGGGGPGGGGPDPEANPFAEEDNTKALVALLTRLEGSPATPPAAATDAPKPAAETKEPASPKSDAEGTAKAG